jgi:hypothetical protein
MDTLALYLACGVIQYRTPAADGLCNLLHLRVRREVYRQNMINITIRAEFFGRFFGQNSRILVYFLQVQMVYLSRFLAQKSIFLYHFKRVFFSPLEIMQPVAFWTFAGSINPGCACKLSNVPQLIGLWVA